MPQRVERDLNRFRQIVRGKIKLLDTAEFIGFGMPGHAVISDIG